MEMKHGMNIEGCSLKDALYCQANCPRSFKPKHNNRTGFTITQLIPSMCNAWICDD
jgi:hypothetical protein